MSESKMTSITTFKLKRPAEACFICKSEYLNCADSNVVAAFSRAKAKGSTETSACFLWANLEEPYLTVLKEQALKLPDYIYFRIFTDQFNTELYGSYFCEEFFPRVIGHFEINGITQSER